jgi:hypothetical protein
MLAYRKYSADKAFSLEFPLYSQEWLNLEFRTMIALMPFFSRLANLKI